MEPIKLWMAVGFLSGALFLGCGGEDDEGNAPGSGPLLGEQELPAPGIPPEDLTGSYALTYSFGQSTCSGDITSAVQEFFPVESTFEVIEQNETEIIISDSESDEDFFSSVDDNDRSEFTGTVSGRGATFELEGSDTLDNGCTISGYERVIFFVDVDNAITGTDVAQVTLSGTCSPFENQTCEIQLNIDGKRTAAGSTSGSLTRSDRKTSKRSLGSIIFER
ncbi:MAG: hypothetical protein HY538_03630 [Deltaproteobacteria bacterium]|nr:hypothetical protein [Deltaproteobacteria bacterium]